MQVVSKPKLQKPELLIKTLQNVPAATTIHISSKKVITILFIFTVLLVIASITGDYLMLHYPADNRYVKKYVEFFYLNDENNLPTLFSAMLLFTASLLNFIIYNVTSASILNRKYKFYWFLLGSIFMYLGLDESLQIHDMLSRTNSLRSLETANQFVYYGWVIPYSIAVLVIGLFFLRFVFSLPVNIRNRFIIAGLIYVGGALGLEFVESYVFNNFGESSIIMKALYTIEETMEMVGAILFIHALLDYIDRSKVIFKVNRDA